MDNLLRKSEEFAAKGKIADTDPEEEFYQAMKLYQLDWYCDWIKEKVFPVIEQMYKIMNNIQMKQFTYKDGEFSFCLDEHGVVIQKVSISKDGQIFYNGSSNNLDDFTYNLKYFGRCWPAIQESFIKMAEEKMRTK